LEVFERRPGPGATATVGEGPASENLHKLRKAREEQMLPAAAPIADMFRGNFGMAKASTHVSILGFDNGFALAVPVFVNWRKTPAAKPNGRKIAMPPRSRPPR
jgi:hypothetical protein